MEETDPYKILGVARDADLSTIKVAYRKLAAGLHPDRNPDGEAQFVAVSLAYDILQNPMSRAMYDIYGTADIEGLPMDCLDLSKRLYEAAQNRYEAAAHFRVALSQTPAARLWCVAKSRVSGLLGGYASAQGRHDAQHNARSLDTLHM